MNFTYQKNAQTARKAHVSGSSLQQYLNSIKHFPILQREEEQTLTHRSNAGDEQAKKRLINSNLRLVVKIARDFSNSNNSLLDLIQEGNVGLIYAVNKFDPTKNIRLSTYAQFWIRAYILKHLMDNHRLVKIGATQNQRKLFYNLHKEEQRMRQMGETPSADKLANSLGVRERDIVEMQQRLGNHEVSLFAPQGNSDSDNCVMDTIASSGDDSDELLDQHIAASHLKDRLASFEEELSGRDSQIWELRMNSDTPLTLQELGEVFSISRERARQLEGRILKRLEKHLQADHDYVDAYRFGKPCVLN